MRAIHSRSSHCKHLNKLLLTHCSSSTPHRSLLPHHRLSLQAPRLLYSAMATPAGAPVPFTSTISQSHPSSSSSSTVHASTSIWLLNASTNGTPAATYPTLTGNGGHYDVVVVGGGMVGVTSALVLKQAGLKVALVEGRRVGTGVTGFSTAKLTSQQNLLYNSMSSKHGQETARLYGEMQEKAISAVEQLVNTHNIKCDFYRLPHATFTTEEKLVDQVRKEDETARAIGLPSSFTVSTDLPASLGVKAAVLFTNQAMYNGYEFCVAAAKLVNGDGSVVYEKSLVNNVTEDKNGPHKITTAEGATLTADSVILATHLPILDRSLHFSIVTPSRSHCIAVRLTSADRNIKQMYISAEGEQPQRSLRRSGHTDAASDDILIISGEPFKTGDETDTTKRYLSLEEWTRKHFPVKEVVCRWSSMDYYSPDLLPYIGLLYRGTSSIYTATGFSKWGLANGMAAALIFKDLIQKRDNPYTKMVDARRWDLLHSAGGMAEEAFHTAKHMFKSLFSPDISTLLPGQGSVVKAKGETVGAYLDPSGKYHLVKPICTHLGCTLVFNQGDIVWDCPCHGSQFDVDGLVIHGPACKTLEQMNHLKW